MGYTGKMPKVKALKEVKTVPKRMFHDSHEANEFIGRRVIGMGCRRNGD